MQIFLRIVFRTVLMICIFICSASFAQEAELGAPATGGPQAKRLRLAVPKLYLRESYPQAGWPELTNEVSSIYSGKNSFDSDSAEVRNEKLMAYCNKIAESYEKRSRRQLKIKEFAEYYKNLCEFTKMQYIDARPIEFAELTAFEANIYARMDTAYFDLHNHPFKNSLIESEEAMAVYEKTPFGLVKIPFKYSSLVLQALLLILFGINAVVLFGRGGK